ncbi:hypothetical protein ACSS7Z_13815 [Microbacterium sp. A82]|uniref:hypothetical protein n=1 Tax=Microbacterium sp. A82 TaxID=3450452 RepID=UPI003F3185A5
MENDSSGDSPKPPAQPTSAQAREALNTLDADGKSLSQRVVTPWWYHTALGLIVALLVGSQAFSGPASIMVVALSIVAIPVLTMTYSSRYGVTVTQPAGPLSRRLLLVTLGVALLAFLAGVAIKVVGASPWWVAIPAVVAFTVTLVLGRRYDDALRNEIAGTRDQTR